MADITPRIVLTGVDKTGAAFATATRNLGALQSRAAGIGAALSPLLGSVGLLSSALSLVSFKNIVNGLDALNDLKDATGASIENISALEDVAARTGTSFETVGTALVKFNAQLKEAKPGSGPAETLKAIGLSAEALKRLDPAEALRQTAVALSAFADDGNKARITQELFGKSIKEVAPLLNDLAKQGQLNATVTTAQAEAAEKFNQQMSALDKNVSDAARAIAGPMVDAVNALFASIKGGNEGFQELSGAATALLVPLQAITVLGANVAFVFQGIGREIGAIAAQAAALARLDFAAISAIRQEVIADGQRERKALDDLEARVLRLKSSAGAAAADFSNEGRNKPKPSAPDVPGKLDTAAADKARSEALANLRKITDGRLKAINEGLESERDLQRFHEQMSKALFDQGLQSLAKFHADQDAARADNLESVRRAVAEEIAARQELLASPLLKGKDKLAERQEIENQIEESRAKLRSAEREAQQAGTLAAVERKRAIEAVTDSVAQLDAQIQALRGNAAAGDLLDIARQVREAEAELRKGGASEQDAKARAAQLGQLLEAQRQVNLARENFSRITGDAADAEERFMLAAQARGDTTLQIEQGLRSIRTQALAQMAEQLRLAEQIAATGSADSPAVQFARQLRLEFERLTAVADPALLRLRQVGDEVADALGKAAGAITLNYKDAKDAVKSLGDQLLQIGTRELVEKPLTDFFRQQLRGLTEGSGGLAGIAAQVFGIGALPARTPGNVQAGASGILPGEHEMAGAIKSITGLGTAASGSADVLGKLPNLAVIPATTAMGALASATQIATQALLQMAASSGSLPGGAGAAGIGSLFGSSFGMENLLGGGFGTGVGFGLQDMALFLHRGGIAGRDGQPTRYHSGGIAGQMPNLRADEVPAILRRGEEVLTQNNPRHRDNAAQPMQITVTQQFTVGNNVDQRTQQQIASMAGRGLAEALRRRGA